MRLKGRTQTELDFSDVLKVMTEVFGLELELEREKLWDHIFYDSTVYDHRQITVTALKPEDEEVTVQQFRNNEVGVDELFMELCRKGHIKAGRYVIRAD